MERKRPRFLRFSVILPEHRFSCLRLKRMVTGKRKSKNDDRSSGEMRTYRLYQIVVWYLRKEMVNDVSSDVVVDAVYPPIVPVEGGQSSPQIAPFLQRHTR